MKNNITYSSLFLMFNCITLFSMDMDYSHQVVNIAPYTPICVVTLCDKNAAKTLAPGSHTIDGLTILIPHQQCGDLIQHIRNNMCQNGVRSIIQFTSLNESLKAVMISHQQYIDGLDLAYRVKPHLPKKYLELPRLCITNIQSSPINPGRTFTINNTFKGDNIGKQQKWYAAQDLVSSVFILLIILYHKNTQKSLNLMLEETYENFISNETQHEKH